jgi:hypothetical protein
MTPRIATLTSKALQNLIKRLEKSPNDFGCIFDAWVAYRAFQDFQDYTKSFADWRTMCINFANDCLKNIFNDEKNGEVPSRFHCCESANLMVIVTVTGGFDKEPYEATAQVVLTGPKAYANGLTSG